MVNVTQAGQPDHDKSLFTASESMAKRRAEAVLSSLLKRMAAGGFVSDVIEVTPELAEMLLARNDGNRVIRRQLVDNIARDMADGRFVLNGEPIIISSCGMLNDGQHRCSAAVQAGKSFRSFVTCGVPRESRTTVDGQQKTRNPGDFLAMDGIANANNIAAAAAYVWQIEKFGSIPLIAHGGHFRPTKQQVSETAHRHYADLEKAFASVPRKGSQKLASYSLLAVTYLLIAKVTGDEEAAKDYIARVVDGANLDVDSPIYVVRERLLKDKRERRFRQSDAVNLMLRGWNAHRRGLSYGRAQRGDGWPKIAR